MAVDLKLVEWINANRTKFSRAEIIEKLKKEKHLGQDIIDSYEEVVKKDAKRGTIEGILAGEKKSIIATIILSLVFPGLGHIYTGAKGTGILIIVLSIFGFFLIFTFFGAIVGIPLVIAMWLWGLIGSINRCEKINKGML